MRRKTLPPQDNRCFQAHWIRLIKGIFEKKHTMAAQALALLHPTMYSEEEYLRLENVALERSEFLRGLLIPKEAEAPDHNLIKEHVIGELGLILRKGKICKSSSGTQRVFVPSISSYFYPDILVVCGPNKYGVLDCNSITNPSVIIEILSPSTHEYDRGEKFKLYRDIDTLQEYVTIDSRKAGAQVFRRMPDNQWILADDAFSLTESITIQTIGATLQMADLYDGTENVSSLLSPPEE